MSKLLNNVRRRVAVELLNLAHKAQGPTPSEAEAKAEAKAEAEAEAKFAAAAETEAKFAASMAHVERQVLDTAHTVADGPSNTSVLHYWSQVVMYNSFDGREPLAGIALANGVHMGDVFAESARLQDEKLRTNVLSNLQSQKSMVAIPALLGVIAIFVRDVVARAAILCVSENVDHEAKVAAIRVAAGQLAVAHGITRLVNALVDSAPTSTRYKEATDAAFVVLMGAGKALETLTERMSEDRAPEGASVH